MANTGGPQTAGFILRYLPIIAVVASIIVSATSAQIQIGNNAEDISDNKSAIQNRVPTFLYEQDQRRLEEELVEVAGNVETNEELVEQVDRSTDQIDSKIELEVERLRNQIQQSQREQDAKLEQILRAIQAGGNSN